jgi:hypothetical protein
MGSLANGARLNLRHRRATAAPRERDLGDEQNGGVMQRKLVRSEPDCSSSLEPFIQRVAETVAWCLPHADAQDARGSLRPDALRPRTLEASYFAAVRHVAPGWYEMRGLQPVPRDLRGGRLMVYFPDAELSDGAAEVESGGFFDVFNAPPWATWVAFAEDEGVDLDISFRRYLIAYVPPVFLDACAAGIEVNPEECIVWLEDADVAFRDLLQRYAPELLWRK